MKRFAKKNMRCVTAILLVLVLLTGCQAGPGTETNESETETEAGYRDGIIGERKNSTGMKKFLGDIGVSAEGIFSGRKSSKSEAEDYVAEAAPAPAEYYGEGDWQPRAGLLTGAEWKDLKHLQEWRAKLQEDAWKAAAEGRRIYADDCLQVTVFDGSAEGKVPVFGAAVSVLAEDGTELAAGRTDISGEVYLFYDTEQKGARPAEVKLGETKYPVQGETMELYADGQTEVRQLDLMLMIDTTGSMGDELEFLKAELKDMVGRIAAQGEALSIRVSVNFYRDEGDDYVVKYYDFREDIEQCLAQMGSEYAEGGGDYPEAVHTALENAVTGHDWRSDAVKLCFMVLDAPPHSESELQGVNASLRKSLKAAAAEGIRIIPVASSGVDTETEYLLRSFAVLTGGTYVFLTNDSGIGGSHKEAEVGEHDVEALNECMIRIACEYCGLEYVKEYEPNIRPTEDPGIPVDPQPGETYPVKEEVK